MPDNFEAVQEGSRWRYARPSSEEVGNWFKTVPLDEGMKREEFVSGVVLIPATEKVKVQTERGTADKHELTFTPYVRVDTRVAYFHKLAAANEQVAVIEPVEVPRIKSGLGYNLHMPDGYWWHIIGNEQEHTRFLCCTMRVALYRVDDWFAHTGETNAGMPLLRPVRFGVSTKQIAGAADPNGLAKAETGAIGRALGVAGILNVGTGIATAEDMQEATGAVSLPAALPEGGEPELSSEQINERLLSLQSEMQAKAPEAWREFAAWWGERKQAEGWTNLSDAPIEVRKGMIARMGSMLAAPVSSPDEGGAEIPVDGAPS